MRKLYKKAGNKLYYWETWENDARSGIMHWGIVGQTGESAEIKSRLFASYKKVIEAEIELRLQSGYAEIDEADQFYLEIEYEIDGFGTAEDLRKRQELENLLDELLGWTGLGYSDGGSSGGGTMEVGCIVVDFPIAKRVIEEYLANTPFADYTNIFELDKT